MPEKMQAIYAQSDPDISCKICAKNDPALSRMAGREADHFPLFNRQCTQPFDLSREPLNLARVHPMVFLGHHLRDP